MMPGEWVVHRGPRSDARDLWRHRWEGPSNPSVGKGPGRWEHLPPTKTGSHEGKAMSIE